MFRLALRARSAGDGCVIAGHPSRSSGPLLVVEVDRGVRPVRFGEQVVVAFPHSTPAPWTTVARTLLRGNRCGAEVSTRMTSAFLPGVRDPVTSPTPQLSAPRWVADSRISRSVAEVLPDRW